MSALLAETMSETSRTLAHRVGELQLTWWHLNAQQQATSAPLTVSFEQIADSAAKAQSASEAVLCEHGAVTLLALPIAGETIVIDLSTPAGLTRLQLATVLKHFHHDLTAASTDSAAIAGFSQQLTQSYEEVNLIYRMAKLLTESEQVRQVVQTMCDELRLTMNYSWTAVSFDDSEAVLAPLRSQLVHSGDLPFPNKTLQAHVESVANSKLRVLTGKADALARAAGSEVLIEPVMQDGLRVATLIAGGRIGSDSDVASSELQLVEAAAGFFSLFHQNAFRFAEQRAQFIGTLHALSASVDAKDPYTQGHSERVALLASQLAEKIGLSAHEVESIRIAGMLHDIGKIGVPEAVLCKPARLSDTEFELIKRHPEIGFRILKDIPSLKFHLPGVLHHHERWDGRGYPHRLAGEQIPLIARILALADTFDAMSSNRAYRKALDRSHVLAEIEKSAGVQFDPSLTGPFVSLDFTRFDEMLQRSKAQHVIMPD